MAADFNSIREVIIKVFGDGVVSGSVLEFYGHTQSFQFRTREKE